MKFLKYLIVASLLQGTIFSFDAEKLDYESLSRQSYTDHVIAFRSLFSVIKVDSFLEFGMGLGTKYFLDNCAHVTSVEISIESRARDIDPWYEECVRSFWRYKNWKAIYHKASDVVDFYNRPLALTYWLEREEYLPDYLEQFQKEIYEICDAMLATRKFDVAFVDPGVYTRVDFVNALFGKVDIIVAHDTQGLIYAWPLLHSHPEYERIDLFTQFGETSFWIKKTKSQLIEDLKKALEI